MSEELPGCPSKGKGFVVCVCTREQKYRKSNAERVVRVTLRKFFRLSFTRGLLETESGHCLFLAFFLLFSGKGVSVHILCK